MHASRTLHLYLCAQTAKPPKRIEWAVWEFILSLVFQCWIWKIALVARLPDNLLSASAVGGSLTSSGDRTRNGYVYINIALNILRSIICLINTTTNPRPNFSSLQNTRQALPYTVLLVDMCTCSWKTIEFMLVSASESAMSFAWYSRTLRMRRGPNTNICTISKTWWPPLSARTPIEFEVYRNDEPWV
jgi:hypothetical protein